MISTRAALLARTLRSFVAVASFALCSTLPARAGETLYASGGGNLSAIYTVDTTTGAATLVWNLPNLYVYAGGLVFDPASDNFYAIGATVADPGTSRLFSIKRSSGVITPFPGMSPTLNFGGGGLAIHPSTGVLYATGSNGFQSLALFTIDTSTGVPTFVGQCGGQCCTAPFGFNMNGLGFRSDGTLFANGFTLSDTPVNGAYSQLFTIDTASGLATHVGPHGVNQGRQLAYSDLAFASDGTLYSMGSLSASANGLYAVDPNTGSATPIGNLVLTLGCDGGLVFVSDDAPTKYCTAKTNSSGCTPSMSWSGLPSASAGSGFDVRAEQVLASKAGLIFYSIHGAGGSPFQGGILCATPPTRRTAIQTSSSTGAPPCTGVYTFDFNLQIASGIDPTLVTGQQVWTQFWTRDGGVPSGTGLTDGVTFTIGL